MSWPAPEVCARLLAFARAEAIPFERDLLSIFHEEKREKRIEEDGIEGLSVAYQPKPTPDPLHSWPINLNSRVPINPQVEYFSDSK